LEADPRVLGQLLAAQNVLPVLPTAKHVAEFYARALASVPGVDAARVCFPGAVSQEGPWSEGGCAGCDAVRARGEGEPLPPRTACGLAAAGGTRVLPLATLQARFGFFALRVAVPAVFDRYEPFIANLASFLALWLDHRLQSRSLERAREALEQRVEERTEELRAANRKLAEEIEVRSGAEAAVRELNRDLEQRVQDRTLALEAANRELEAFAYSASHDLRAPLRHIGGFLELLRKRAGANLDAQSLHYFDAISGAAGRMATLIDDLLSFSRMGRCELSRGRVDLGALVQEVLRDLEPETRGRIVRWQVGPLPVVTGDRAMLRVVLVNLLANAVKFTRPREAAEIAIEQTPGPESEIVVAVRDNGVGFDMAYADRLFGVFERLHRATDFEGTGVGLANVRRIVLRHGGRAWAEGAVGRGATFYFSLPRAAPAPA
jgi:signal transduction histidine kinase